MDEKTKLPFNLYSPLPGHPDWDEIEAEARELADNIARVIDLDTGSSAEKRERMRRRAAGYAQNVKNYFINRKRLFSHNHNLLPMYFIWTMTNKCNFRCSYCDDHMGRHYFDLSNEGILDTDQGMRLLRIMRTGTSALYFCGGEPTLREDLPIFTREAVRIGYFPIMINTNGALLHKQLQKPEWRDWLKNMDMIIVSCDALNVGLLNKLYKVKQGRRVLVNILMLRHLREKVNFKFAVNTVIMPENLAEARKVLDWANDLGIWFAPVPINLGAAADRKLMDSLEYKELGETILARKKAGYRVVGSRRLLEMTVKGAPYKCYTTLKPHVNPNGDVVWPCKATVNVKPEFVNVLDYDNVKELWDAAAKRLNVNDFHGPAKNQCGGHCNWLQNYTTARYIAALEHPLTSGFIEDLRELRDGM